MGNNFGFVVDLASIALDENNGTTSSWVHALPLGTYKHPIYGTIDVNKDRAMRFADSVNNQTRGIEPSINFNHNNQDIAAGWAKKGEARVDGVWLFVEWTADAAKAIKEKKYKYFSAEYADEWEDNQGKKFQDVIFGGALTNRPFMKNLTPINLSEETYALAFDLVAAATGKTADDLKGGTGMGLSDEDLKKITEGVAAKLIESQATKTEPTPGQSLMNNADLKALAEENPLVKALLSAVESQNASIADSAQKLKEADIQRRLAEFDRTNIVLSKVARQRVAHLADKMPAELLEEFWKLLADMKSSSSFLVELGERAGATVGYGSPKSASEQMKEAVSLLTKNNSTLSLSDAYDQVSRENPELYKRYREEQMVGAN